MALAALPLFGTQLRLFGTFRQSWHNSRKNSKKEILLLLLFIIIISESIQYLLSLQLKKKKKTIYNHIKPKEITTSIGQAGLMTIPAQNVSGQPQSPS